MSKVTAGRKGRASALAGIASFFRQLSLFDAVPEPVAERTRPSETRRLPQAAQEPSAAETAIQATAIAEETAIHPGQPAAFSDLCRGPYAHIQVVPKPRLWESWRVTWTRRNEALRLDVPAILVDAPRDVKEAILEWSVLVTKRGSNREPVLRARRTDLETLIRDHLRAPDGSVPSGTAAKRSARNRRKADRLNPQGTHHHLDEIFRAVNARYFQGTLQAKLTWSARLGGLSTHSVAQDGDGNAYHLISISRGYDAPEVSPEILGGVVYHECLHIAIPPRREGGRRVVHGADFRRREREYEHYEIWRRWHRDGLPKALRRLKRAR